MDASAAYYSDPTDAFAWLAATDTPQAEFADDVVDALRALRAADVLRQRGTALRTSGGYEVFFDARTADAVCSMPDARYCPPAIPGWLIGLTPDSVARKRS